MTQSNGKRGVKTYVLCIAAAAAMVACAAAAWARPESPKRIFYGTHADSRVVVVQGVFHPPGNVVQIYYRCRTTAQARAVLDVAGRSVGNLPCDDKVHWMRNHKVKPGERHPVTLRMLSGGNATVSVWGGP